MKKIAFFCCIFTLFIGFSSKAQTRVLVYKTDISELETGLIAETNAVNQQNLGNIANQIVQVYATNDDFTVIDRANLNLIKKEQEIQKSEEFIDGYVVEQGKQEGADYIFYSKYIRKEKTILLRVYDVADGTIKCAAEEEVKTTFGMTTNTRTVVSKLLNQINADCFEISFEIVRAMEEKKGKTKTLLMAAGRSSSVKLGHVLEIFVNRTEKVGDKELTRQETVGVGVVIKVEDQNFSVLEVDEGGKEIATALSSGLSLFCKMK